MPDLWSLALVHTRIETNIQNRESFIGADAACSLHDVQSDSILLICHCI